jgi:DNA-binding response OmpR family regulator
VVSVRIDDSVLDPTAPAPANGDTTAKARRQEKAQESRYYASEVRILVLDDDPSVCRVIQATLAHKDFTVDAVSDPAQMEVQLREKSYHIVILDYVIPGLESERVMGWVREHQPDASVIVVTAFPTIDSALHCLRAGTFDYLTKPFQVAQLQRVVMRCLEGKGLLRMSEEALRESLGAAIRERRKALGLTLAQMAQRTNVSLGYLSQIELGKNSASIETLYRISLGLGVKIADLFQSVQMPA